MNLFENPSLTELQRLLINEGTESGNHTIVIDFDGEVLIDADRKLPHIDLKKFKFLLQFKKDQLLQGTEWIKNLMKSLVNGWEQNPYRLEEYL